MVCDHSERGSPYSASSVEVVRLPQGTTEPDEIAVEPLEIRVDGRPIAVTMRTPGHDEELSVGFLRSEGSAAVSRSPCGRPRRQRRSTWRSTGRRLRPARSGTSTRRPPVRVCGKGALEAVAVEAPRVESELVVPSELVGCAARPAARGAAAFAATGGLHATGLFSSGRRAPRACGRTWAGTTRWTRSIGWAFGDGLAAARRTSPLRERPSLVRARQKAAVAGCPVVVAIGAPSTLAVDLARDRGVTLCGFVRGGRVNVYLGAAAHRMTFNVAPRCTTASWGATAHALGRALSERAGVRPGMRALDVGAGTGKLHRGAHRDPGGRERRRGRSFRGAVRFGGWQSNSPLPMCGGELRRSFPSRTARSTPSSLSSSSTSSPIRREEPRRMARVAKGGRRRCGSGLGLPWRDDHAEGVLGGGGRGRRARRSGSRRAHADALWRAGGGRAALGRSRPSRRRGRQIGVSASYEDFDDLWEPFLAGVGPGGDFTASLEPRGASSPAGRSTGAGLGSPEGPFELQARAWYAVGTR